MQIQTHTFKQHMYTSSESEESNACVMFDRQNISSQKPNTVSARQNSTVTEEDKCASNNTRQAE